MRPPGRRRLAAVREATLGFPAPVGAGVARSRISRQWLASGDSPWTASPRPAHGGAWRAAGGDSGLGSSPTQRPGSSGEPLLSGAARRLETARRHPSAWVLWSDEPELCARLLSESSSSVNRGHLAQCGLLGLRLVLVKC